MSKPKPCACAQSQRALRLLLPPDLVRIDRVLFNKAMPKQTPKDLSSLIPLVIDLILALLENKDPEAKDKDDEPAGPYEQLANDARQLAAKHVPAGDLIPGAHLLVESINYVCTLIDDSNFVSPRVAREFMRLANHNALGDIADNWEMWNDQIRKVLDLFAADYNLTTLQHYKKAWTAIAKGLARI